MGQKLTFKPVSSSDMVRIVKYFPMEKGRSCDISYGGILMWTPLFNYEYAEVDDTLFIKGKTAEGTSYYYPPIGKMSMQEAIQYLKVYNNGQEVVFYPVPEYSLERFNDIDDVKIENCPGLGDYIYDIETLATLKGKKMSKKRNHVNQFVSLNPDWSFEPLTKENLQEVIDALGEIEKDAQQTEGARTERELTERYLSMFTPELPGVHGGVLRAAGKPVGVTVGDVRGDTLFVQIEKASRDINGAHEMTNKMFASEMLSRYPELKYVNREEDAGDPGLRYAKESYHPIGILEKYLVRIS